MCGIWAIFGCEAGSDIKHYASAFKISHRGPDCFQMQNSGQLRNCTMAFHRLCVVDSVRGMQPMRLQQYPHLTLMCNGEIYNFRKLAQEFNFHRESDCDIEIILHLYERFGAKKTCSLLDGVFAFVILDTRARKVTLARDTYGVRPMFYFFTKSGMLGACSEAKGLVDILSAENGERQLLKAFPPAHFEVYDVKEDGKLAFISRQKFHLFSDEPQHWKYQGIELLPGKDEASAKENIRTLLINAVEKRLMSSRRVGSLLSGGLDSSLVAAITAKKLKQKGCKLPLQTFSVALGESPDVVAARKVADHIGSEHREVVFTIQEAINAVQDAIYSTESYDVITIRGATPMCLLCRYISENTDNIVVMSGEGADELAQGYIYFHKQPTAEDGDIESRRLLEDLYMYDVLRMDRSASAHGLEVRAPFLDHALAWYFLSLPPELRSPKDGMEKHLVRSAFSESGIIPEEILWRRKEGFSDGVLPKKKPWHVVLQEVMSSKVTDEQLANAASTFPHNAPKTKEAYYYRSVYESKFGSQLSQLIPYQWWPRWVECQDPSAMALAHYQNDEDD